MKKLDISNFDFGNWPLPKEVLTELGRINALWTTLESFLLLCIGKLAGYQKIDDMRPHILLIHTSFQQKIDLFSSLCDYLSKESHSLSNYSQVVTKLKIAQKGRNQFAHQGVVLNEETNELELVMSSARGKLKTNVSKIDMSEIKKVVIDIDEANSALYKLILKKELKPVWERIMDGEKKFK